MKIKNSNMDSTNKLYYNNIYNRYTTDIQQKYQIKIFKTNK